MIKETKQLIYCDEEARIIRRMVTSALIQLPDCSAQKLIPVLSRLYQGNYSVLVWELEMFTDIEDKDVHFSVDQGVRVVSVLNHMRKFLKDADLDLIAKMYYEATSAEIDRDSVPETESSQNTAVK